MQLAATMCGVMVFRFVESGRHLDLVGVGRSGVRETPGASTAVQNRSGRSALRGRVLGTLKLRSPGLVFPHAVIGSRHQWGVPFGPSGIALAGA